MKFWAPQTRAFISMYHFRKSLLRILAVQGLVLVDFLRQWRAHGEPPRVMERPTIFKFFFNKI